MTSNEYTKILDSIDNKEINKAIEILHSTGMIHDESHTFLSSGLIEHHTDILERRLRNNGYTGGPLRNCARYYPHHGAIYAVYNSHELSLEDVMHMLNKTAASFSN